MRKFLEKFVTKSIHFITLRISCFLSENGKKTAIFYAQLDYITFETKCMIYVTLLSHEKNQFIDFRLRRNSMQLKLSTDYAIRIILYLAKTGKVNSKQLAGALNISQNYVRKMIREPELENFILSSSGVYGGLSLKQEAANITLLDIITAIEKSTFISYCLEDEVHCDTCLSFDKQYCPVRICYEKIQMRLNKVFEETSIQDLIQEEICYERKAKCS